MQSEKVGRRIREYREKAGYSQEDVAEKIGLSVTGVSNIERGRNYPKMDVFIKIANVLGVSADLLLYDVIDASQTAKESELSQMLQNVTDNKRKQICRMIEVMCVNDD